MFDRWVSWEHKAGFSTVNSGLWLQLLLKSWASPERRLSSLHTDLPKGAPVKRSRLRVNLWLLSFACRLSHSSRVQLFATLWTIACQAPLSMGFCRQKYWSGLLCLLLGNLPHSGIEPSILHFLHWQAGPYHLNLLGSPNVSVNVIILSWDYRFLT